MNAFRLITRFLAVVVAVTAMVPVLASGAHAQTLQVRFVTFNVDFNNTAQQIDSDIQAVKPESDIIMFQEAKWVTIASSFGSGFTVYQITNQGDGKAGSALAIRNSVASQVLATGILLGVDNHGEQMEDRYIVWADVRLTNGLVIRAMAMHMPPARFEYLQPIMADNLVAFVALSPYPVIVGADWNYTVNNDPYSIQVRTGLVPRGVGIDGFHYAGNAADFVSLTQLTGLNVNSDHDPVRLVLNTHVPTNYVVDNAYGGFTASSGWSTATAAADKYGMDYRFKGQGSGSSVIFRPNLSTAGSYKVFEWHPEGANRTQEAPHFINYDGAMDVVLLNQESNGGVWNQIGIFNFAAGNGGNVMITDQIPEVSPEVVVADAIKFVYVGVPAPPVAPVALSGTVVSSSQIDLLWENSLNETGYVVARGTVSGGPYTDISALGANVITYSDTGLEDGTNYFYVVRGLNAAGASGNSSEVTVATPLNPPAAPSNAVAAAAGQTQINLAWTDNSAKEAAFVVARASILGGPYTDVATLAANTTSHIDTGLTANTSYYYVVHATNAGGSSSNSNEANATTLPNPPVAPASLGATAVHQTQINLAWADNSSNETNFVVARANAAGGPYTDIATLAANVTSYNNTGLTANTRYYYVVRATNTGGSSANSSEANAITLPYAPAAPGGLTATAASQTQINLTWTDGSSNETNFVVARASATGGPYTDIVTLAANSTSYANTGLTANTRYYYVVRAINTGGSSANSNVANALTWPSDIIVDNSSASFSASSNWSTGTSATDKYGTNYRYRNTGAVSDVATWTIAVPQSRNYEISAWWPQGTNRSQSAPFIMPDGTQVAVNQQTNGGKWNTLATRSVSAGSQSVKLSCWTTSGYVVMADAVKLTAR